MFRCLGSCKLHKQLVLVPDGEASSAVVSSWTPRELFIHSLVGDWDFELEMLRGNAGNWMTTGAEADIQRHLDLQRSKKRLISMLDSGDLARKATSHSTSRFSPSLLRQGQFCSGNFKATPSPFPALDAYLNETLKELPTAAPGRVNRYCIIGAGDGGAAANCAECLVFQVEGSRYCRNIKREHKSNAVYLVVSLRDGTWVQKCFDPDCSLFRSEATLIPAATLATIPRKSPGRHETASEALLVMRTLDKARAMRTLVTL